MNGEGKPPRFILDTHVLIYWLFDDPHLSSAQRDAVTAASANAPLWVADISLWEIATLVSLDRLRLEKPLRDWLEAAVAPPLVRRVGITPTIAAEVAQLPDSFTRDPGDRIIVAAARTLGATLLTQDERIINSGLVTTIS